MYGVNKIIASNTNRTKIKVAFKQIYGCYSRPKNK